ncbi:MAG: hypothetical protein ACI837_003307 [Crocinitomicaceae bacterium]|jgi:hypothetical protein
MMRFITCTIGLILTVHSFGQSRLFITEARKLVQIVDVATDIEEIIPSSEDYDFLAQGSESLEQLFIAELKRNSRSRPDELMESATLAALSDLATRTWKGSHYSDSKKWNNLRKYFKRAANRSTSRFNLMKEMSFRISLVDNHGRKFYHDRSGMEGELNLFFGKKPKSKPGEDEELEDPVPLNFFSEQVIVEDFMKQIRRKHVLTDLKKGNFAYVGLSIEIDERTLNRNRIPTARVVVVFGARRLKDVKVKARPVSPKPPEELPSSISKIAP